MIRGLRYSLSLIMCVMLLLSFTACDDFSEDTVLEINGVAISEEEYSLVMSTLRSDVVLYYSENYSETDFGDTFWNKRYGQGEQTPAERLYQMTEDKLAENHSILDWAKKEGLIEDNTFAYLISDMKRENEERAEKIKNNQVVYGLSQFTIDEYYDYVISKCSVNLRNLIIEKLTDSEIETYYEENKDEMYKEPAVFECKQLIVSGSDDPVNAKAVADRIMKNVNNGMSLDKAAESESLTLTDEIYDLSQIRTLSLRLPSVSAALYEMEEGQTRLIEEFSDYYILHIKSKSENGYISKEEVLTSIQTSLAIDKFDAEVAKRAEKAEISVNEKALKTIKITDSE